MHRPALLLASVILVVAGCQALPGVEGLVAELQARGLPAAVGSTFNDMLLGGDGTTVCIGDESVSVYEFPDQGEAQAAAGTINRADPSQVGNSIVEWVGPPRFWLRDRLIIQYVGDNVAVDTALRNILGQPFAEGQGGGRGPLPGRPACH